MNKLKFEALLDILRRDNKISPSLHVEGMEENDVVLSRAVSVVRANAALGHVPQ